MCVRGGELQAVGKMSIEGHVIPLTNFFRVQVEDDRQCVKLVEAGSYVPVFDVGEAAQVNNKIGTPTLARQFVTGPFNVPVGQSETFASIPETRARVHFWLGELTRWANVSNSHRVSIAFLLRIQNGTVLSLFRYTDVQ